ncbi:MAG: crossover junction endodeoxyribonuclease RuvC [Candidatus Borkfalkiaceae bacterium]|nr:crossover junction endodeoxyribonuclease RuvC [Christensenellaceae bacterium]
MIILGIDPGLATMGFGVVKKDERGIFSALDYGVVTTSKNETLPVRLAALERGVNAVIDKYRPDEIAFEELFFTKNITTGIAVAQARGVTLLACVKKCSALYEYTPMQIKQAVTGYGKADKKQMQEVVTALLRLKSVPRPDDAADALAVALCHGFTNRFGEMFAVGNSTRGAGKNAVTGSYFRSTIKNRARANEESDSGTYFAAETEDKRSGK